MMLTERTTDVVRLMMEGNKFAEIGQELGIKTRTVKAHLDRVYRQMNIIRGTCIPSVVVAIMLDITPPADRFTCPVRLQQKEKQVLLLIAEGFRNPDIGELMGTTEHVVKNYLRVIYDKTGLSNRVSLALWAKHYKSDLEDSTYVPPKSKMFDRLRRFPLRHYVRNVQAQQKPRATNATGRTTRRGAFGNAHVDAINV